MRPLPCSALVIGVVLFALPRPGFAQARRPVVDAQPETHEGGYLRLMLGAGWTSTSNGESEVNVSGFGRLLSLGVGTSIASNTILSLEFLAASASNQTGKGDRADYVNHGASTSILAAGPGITYYLMPWNAFVSLTVTILTKLAVKNEAHSGGSDFGLGGAFTVGKEWRLPSKLAFGLAGTCVLAGAEAGGTTWATTTCALALSATYN